jgi:allantoicase
MYPDGGIARLRVYGDVVNDWSRSPPDAIIDLAAVENGGVAVGCSNQHFGEPRNLIGPGRGINMGDGWETARKLTRPAVLELGASGFVEAPGSDWAVLKLGAVGTVLRIEVDTCHFKGNFPESCVIEGCLSPQAEPEAFGDAEGGAREQWRAVLPRAKLKADLQHYFDVASGTLTDVGPITHLRVSMFPDGGISRVRAFGMRQVSSSL